MLHIRNTFQPATDHDIEVFCGQVDVSIKDTIRSYDSRILRDARICADCEAEYEARVENAYCTANDL